MELVLIPGIQFRLFFGFHSDHLDNTHMQKYNYSLLNINLLKNNLQTAPYATHHSVHMSFLPSGVPRSLNRQSGNRVVYATPVS